MRGPAVGEPDVDSHDAAHRRSGKRHRGHRHGRNHNQRSQLNLISSVVAGFCSVSTGFIEYYCFFFTRCSGLQFGKVDNFIVGKT